MTLQSPCAANGALSVEWALIWRVQDSHSCLWVIKIIIFTRSMGKLWVLSILVCWCMFPKWCFFWGEGCLLQFLSFSTYFRGMDSIRGRILMWADNPSWNEPEGTRRAVLSELAGFTGQVRLSICAGRVTERLPTANSLPLKILCILETSFFMGSLVWGIFGRLSWCHNGNLAGTQIPNFWGMALP